MRERSSLERKKASLTEKLVAQAEPRGRSKKTRTGPDIPRKPLEALGNRSHRTTTDRAETGVCGARQIFPI